MKYLITAICFFTAAIILFDSCSKGGTGGGGTGGGTNSNPCSGVTVLVDGIVSNPSASGAADGSIAATAQGSTGLTFSINGGAFQASANFTSLVAGTYTISAKNGNNCSGSRSFTLISQNLCPGITITVANSTTTNTPCQSSNSGSITVSGTGGAAPFTYSLNGGAFQSSNLFSNLSTSNYSITAKDANGCTGSANVTVNDTPAGPLFSAVRTLLQNNCSIAGCHLDGQLPFFPNQCIVVANNFLIKARAVDGNPTPMPPTGLLPVSDRQKITDWINAGGQINN